MNGSEEHLHQEMEINYFKIKIVQFIINLDETMPLVMEKSKSKRGVQYPRNLP